MARWPGGQSLYLVGKNLCLVTMATVAALTIIRLYWWPGGRVASHNYLVDKIYKLRSMIRRAKCFSKALDQFVISLRYRGHRGHLGHRLCHVSPMDDRMPRLFSDAHCPKASAEKFAT